MTVSEERFDFLARKNWTQGGENHILQRTDKYHMTLGLCYYKPAGQFY